MMQLTLSCVVFVAVLFLHAQQASAGFDPHPEDAVDWKSGDSREDDDASEVDDLQESGELYHITTLLERGTRQREYRLPGPHTQKSKPLHARNVISTCKHFQMWGGGIYYCVDIEASLSRRAANNALDKIRHLS